MKNNLLIAFVLVPLLGQAQAGNPFTLTGKVTDYRAATDGTIYLKYKQNDSEVNDSTRLINGTYTFKGLISYPVEATLKLKVADSIEKFHARTRILRDYAHEFYLDKGNLTANSNEKLNKTIVKGSKSDDDQQELQAKLVPYYAAGSKLYQEEGAKLSKSKDSLAMANYLKKSYKNMHQIDSVKKDYLFNHANSGIILDLLQEYTRSKLDPSEIEPLFEKIQPGLRASIAGQAYGKRIQQAKVSANGSLAPDFVLKDKNGKEISLSSLKGKLVLLDFWGSWCNPCRKTHPHLRKLYAAYKSRGFEILGVSNELGKPEENYKKWTAALEEDKMEWINVLNDKDKSKKEEGVLEMYSVKAFPTKVLIDKNGVIIQRFVGNSMENEKELDEILHSRLNP